MSLGIKGFTPTSLIDWPGKIAAVIFFPGCNFRCHYCYNPEFIKNPGSIEDIDDEFIFNYLEKKKKWLDGVVLLGGEPTIHKSFYKILKRVKDMGLEVCVHTNGTTPKILREIIKKGLVEYIAMDIKAPLYSYKKVVDVNVDTEAISQSVEIIKGSNQEIDYEFRTTVVKDLFNEDDFREIGEWISGSKRYFIQQFKSGKTLDPKYKDIKPYRIPELLGFKKIAKKFIKEVEIRGV